VITARKAAPVIGGTYYRIIGDDEVKEAGKVRQVL
jgi:hypothetical protein